MSETKKRKVVVTGRMDPDLLARAKAMVYWTPGMTFSSLIEDALRNHMEVLEAKNGPAKPAPGLLRTGRPLSMKGTR